MAGVHQVLKVSRVALQPGSYPAPGETIQLSFLDSIWVTLRHMQCIFLYPDTADGSFPAILDSLKTSLGLILPSFHPFAGKLTYKSSAAKAIIDCSASAIREGVTIIEAESDLDIHCIAKEEVHDLESFVQLVPNITVLELPTDVLAVQVTRFSNGGVALVIAMHHAVADGRGLWQFMEAWASTCRTGSVPSVPMPVHDRAIINYPGGDEIAKDFTKKLSPALPKIVLSIVASCRIVNGIAAISNNLKQFCRNLKVRDLKKLHKGITAGQEVQKIVLSPSNCTPNVIHQQWCDFHLCALPSLYLSLSALRYSLNTSGLRSSSVNPDILAGFSMAADKDSTTMTRKCMTLRY
ncbi:malonyl-coenzyme A:anthocyanin 3-O-glucoside-6''-O-malonyltransferase-like protein [Carex littledalei]|uniref:Malonyl-coenzyme A:anthocyanin 3-O-glucoside-6''-O-malonyltransferase-like protein n=1 Tax=Carex littledalei TaxID=544730 RepID=A0A833V794_9POAL|nr:malonyl-coenzyme A:anthocyanin 3-O-glucoside-6''-O-malonyltransferase-like protein [Carex littledalei]